MIARFHLLEFLFLHHCLSYLNPLHLRSLASKLSWIVEREAFIHMTSPSFVLAPLTSSTSCPLVTIAYCHSYPVKGHGSTTPTPSLPLRDAFYVPSFPVNLYVMPLPPLLTTLSLFSLSIILFVRRFASLLKPSYSLFLFR